MASPYQIISYQKFILGLMRLAPSELFNEATTTLLMPSVRSLGPLTMEQVQGVIPSPLPLGQSLLVVWPQLTGLIAATVICFAISYIMFMRREIRSRYRFAPQNPQRTRRNSLNDQFIITDKYLVHSHSVSFVFSVTKTIISKSRNNAPLVRSNNVYSNVVDDKLNRLLPTLVR